jgi:hypothetical protein
MFGMGQVVMMLLFSDEVKMNPELQTDHVKTNCSCGKCWFSKMFINDR